MTGGHPDGLPDLFLDRSLGRRQVPDVLRAYGLRLCTFAEVYGVPQDERVADEVAIAEVGDRDGTIRGPGRSDGGVERPGWTTREVVGR